MAGGRARRSNVQKNYAVDPFEGIVDLIEDDPASDAANENDREVNDDAGEQSQTRTRQTVVNLESEDDDESDAFQPNAEASDGDDDAEMPTVVSDPSDNEPDDSDVEVKPRRKPKRAAKSHPPPRKKQRARDGRALPRQPVAEDGTSFTRGYPTGMAQHPAKAVRRMYYFGGTDADLALPMKTRRKYAYEPCLPSRRADEQGYGGFLVPPALKAEMQRAETNWAWFDRGGGRERWLERQRLREADAHEAKEYMGCGGSTDVRRRPLVSGPVDDMRLTKLDVGSSQPLAEAFQSGDSKAAPDYKRGFILNLGARVHCLDWAPNQRGGRQFLAVSILPHRPEDDPGADKQGRAFAPLPPYKSSIEIWEFATDANESINTLAPPRRALTFCSDYGDVKALKWCPIPSDVEDRLGFLACITGDGALRVYYLPKPPDSADGVAYRVDAPAFEARAPHTVYTAITWLSSRRIAAACANGCLAIWDIADCLSSSDSHPPRPDAYFSLSTTYILALTSCWPSFPHILLSSSMTGFLSLTDLTFPRPGDPAATVLSARSRAGHTQLLWHDHCKSALTVDDSDAFRALPLRMFFVSCGVGRERSRAMASASSPLHPFVLVGTAAGDVVATNPAPRIVGGGKKDIWTQRWFAHEWRRPREDEPADLHGEDGLSRMAEGFKPVKGILAGNDLKDANVKDSVSYATIHEEKTAITALAWNPNLHVAGWAAAGMGDGLLRVEDLAS